MKFDVLLSVITIDHVNGSLEIVLFVFYVKTLEFIELFTNGWDIFKCIDSNRPVVGCKQNLPIRLLLV
jgi:hypothetical protein